MTKFSWTILFSMLCCTCLQAQQTLEQALFELPDVIFKPIKAPEGYEAAYELSIKQALDHNDPSKGHFYQRAYLSHKGFDRPTVICTEGYQRPSNRMYELTTLLEANQIDVEHRYFGTSMPDSLDYTYLNFEQMAGDLHKINQLFRQIYKGKWVSTGISKGGTSTIFYRYFYPDDVDVSVPYVAPLNYDDEDERIYDFLDKVGSEACRADIKAIQMRLLENREGILPLLKWYSKGAGYEFTYLTFEEAFEYAVLEYPFSFWQWGHDCSTIPDQDADLEKVIQHLMDVVGLSFYADKDMAAYASHYYQSGTEMGYYGYETEEFENLLRALPTKPHPSAVFAPNKMAIEFDGTLTNKVADWIKTKGNQFIYIYGGVDTWTATGVPESDKVEAEWFILEGEGHARARIKYMSEADKIRLVKVLEKWLGVDIEEKP